MDALTIYASADYKASFLTWARHILVDAIMCARCPKDISQFCNMLLIHMDTPQAPFVVSYYTHHWDTGGLDMPLWIAESSDMDDAVGCVDSNIAKYAPDTYANMQRFLDQFAVDLDYSIDNNCF
jgi:hypothetical protein